MIGFQLRAIKPERKLALKIMVSSDINNFYYPDNGYIRIFGI